MNDSVLFIIAIGVVVVVVILQIYSFLQTRKKIKVLQEIFPDTALFRTQETTINTTILNDPGLLKIFLEHPIEKKAPADKIEGDNDITLVDCTGKASDELRDILTQTNKYLCKNIGTTAELTVLQDICERKLEVLDSDIHHSLNTPLYLGLAGTFIGIIIGLSGIDFNNITELSSLKYGIIAAMCASLFGLLLMLINTAIIYGAASSKVENRKLLYFDFLRRELMPTLANDISTSLNSLKGVLGHFVDKFGRNLDSYADSAELLNDNLDKQYLVLDQIQQLKLPTMANMIADSFKTLKESSDSVTIFHSYQKELNDTISSITTAVSNINTIIAKFTDFSDNLAVVVSNQTSAIELQQQFRESLETHFPTGSEGRNVWRQEFDYLTADAKMVTTELNNHLVASSQYIKQFVEENHDFFDSFSQLRSVLDKMVEYTNVQADCYKDLKDEILSLRKDAKDSQRGNNQLTQELINSVKAMTDALQKIEKHNK